MKKRGFTIRFKNRKQLEFVLEKTAELTEARRHDRNIETVIETLEDLKIKMENEGAIVK